MPAAAATAAAIDSCGSSDRRRRRRAASEPAATATCSERSSISAHMCLIAWKLPIGLPNCSRTFAYSVAVCSVHRGQPGGLGGQHRRGEILDPLPRHGQDLGGCVGEHDPGQRAGEVGGRQRFDGDPVGGGVDEKEGVVGGQQQHPAGVGAQARIRRCPMPGRCRSLRSAASARPAVRSPDASASSRSARELGTTSVAMAVVAIGPGTIAAAASSTIAHRSSTVPPAPPDSSGKATPKMPSWARPAYGARQACGSPCSTSRAAFDGVGSPRPSYGPVHARQTARR